MRENWEKAFSFHYRPNLPTQNHVELLLLIHTAAHLIFLIFVSVAPLR